jgi:hypothetical protein
MGSSFSTRPTGASAAASRVQSASRAADRAVATQLPASQSVTVIEAGAGTGYDQQTAGDYPWNQTVLERSAAWFVDQVVDSRTSQQPYTDEASLRRRAYFETLHLTRRAPTRPLATDRKA